MSILSAEQESLNLRPRHRWAVVEYHRMGEVGLLNEDSRVELIDGEIIEVAPIGSLHGGNVNRFIRLFSRVVSDKAIVTAQNPVVLDSYSEPEPDIALLRWRVDDYEQSHPRAFKVTGPSLAGRASGRPRHEAAGGRGPV